MFSRQPPIHDLRDYQALTAWYQSPLGQHLLQREQQLINELLGRRFGYHLLQLSCADLQLHAHSPMGHKFAFTPFAQAADGYQAVAEPEAIPLVSSSVDCVVLHHTLDFAQDQHQLLREATRVLIAGGHIVIVGFNPLSMWGLRQSLSFWHKKAPWQARMLGSFRLSDWLQLLDFHIDDIRYAEYALPINLPRVIRHSSWLDKWATRINWPTGGIYVIAARKQVLPLIPVQRQRARRVVLPLAMPVTKREGQDLPVAACEQQK